jgi:hypothetical protein
MAGLFFQDTQNIGKTAVFRDFAGRWAAAPLDIAVGSTLQAKAKG